MIPLTYSPSVYPAVNTPPRILLGPGPSMVNPRVTAAMTRPMVGYLDPTFLQVMDEIQAMLRYLFQTQNTMTLPISGTGTAGMETAVANMVEPSDNVLVCIHGYFGMRIAEMARRYGGNVETITKPWGEVFQPDEIRDTLQKRPAQVVAIVHGETSTGARQSLEGIAEIVHEQGGILIVDTVASLGGVPILVDALGIDVCYSGSQKCMSAPPGVAPITFSPRAMEKIEKRPTPVPNWYLDLGLLAKYWGELRQYHHTPPIATLYGVHESLRLISEEGLDYGWQRHQQCAEMLWSGLEALGLSMHVALDARLASLTTVVVPNGVDEANIRRQLLTQYNIEIAGGLGELKGKVWRVGLMGYSARPENVHLLLALLRDLL